jgi:hypothetical protein
MDKFKLHYAELELQDDIPCFEFDSKYKMLDYISNIYKNNHFTTLNKVCLVAIWDDLIVVDSVSRIIEFVNNGVDNHLSLELQEVFLQEYDSYEEAYKVALNMKEDSPLCYSNKINDTKY